MIKCFLKGNEFVRNKVAEFVSERDGGLDTDPERIFLTMGASRGIKTMIQFLTNDINGTPAGFMIPVPQYPIFWAAITEFGSHPVSLYNLKLMFF